MKMLPLVYAAGMFGIGLLTVLPWRPQTPWAMVCSTLLTAGAMLLAHWDDNPEDDDGEDERPG